MSSIGRQVASAFAAACSEPGLDLCQAFPVGLFNRTVALEDRLPSFDRDDALAVLVGNTRRLWPAFRGALARDPARLQGPDPLDRYVMETVTAAAAAAAAAGGVPHQVLFGHTMHPRPIPVQRIARAIGLGALSPSYLSVHPQFGPWIALRAVVVFDVAAPPSPMQPATEPCASCARPCVPALERALGAAGLRPPAQVRIESDWRQWLAVRDACPVGREHRYPADQIAYHYTKSAALLQS